MTKLNYLLKRKILYVKYTTEDRFNGGIISGGRGYDAVAILLTDICEALGLSQNLAPQERRGKGHILLYSRKLRKG